MIFFRVGGDPFCSWCNLALESTAHPFFECPRFVRIWVAAPSILPFRTSHKFCRIDPVSASPSRHMGFHFSLCGVLEDLVDA